MTASETVNYSMQEKTSRRQTNCPIMAVYKITLGVYFCIQIAFRFASHRIVPLTLAILTRKDLTDLRSGLFKRQSPELLCERSMVTCRWQVRPPLRIHFQAIGRIHRPNDPSRRSPLLMFVHETESLSLGPPRPLSRRSAKEARSCSS